MLPFDLLHYPLPHFSERGEGSVINAIVLHCIGMPSLEAVFDAFKQHQVSAHFLVPRLTGRDLKNAMPMAFGNQVLQFPDQVPVIQLVDPLQKAWHAGKSQFGSFNQQAHCKTSLNACSIGIEFHAPGYANGDLYCFVSYSDQQQQTGIALMDFLTKTYPIPKQNVLAHSTISVGRKTDPGPYFFWQALHEAGFGYLPNCDVTAKRSALNPSSELIADIQTKLNQIGFQGPNHGTLDQVTLSIIDAYMLQFTPTRWNGRHANLNQALIDSLDQFDFSIFH